MNAKRNDNENNIASSSNIMQQSVGSQFSTVCVDACISQRIEPMSPIEFGNFVGFHNGRFLTSPCVTSYKTTGVC